MDSSNSTSLHLLARELVTACATWLGPSSIAVSVRRNCTTHSDELSNSMRLSIGLHEGLHGHDTGQSKQVRIKAFNTCIPPWQYGQTLHVRIGHDCPAMKQGRGDADDHDNLLQKASILVNIPKECYFRHACTQFQAELKKRHHRQGLLAETRVRVLQPLLPQHILFWPSDLPKSGQSYTA